MRLVLILLLSSALTGCTAMLVGGGSAGSYEAAKAERTASEAADDSAITTRIRGKHAADPLVSQFDVRVKTYEGTVTLWGTVSLANATARSRARMLPTVPHNVTVPS